MKKGSELFRRVFLFLFAALLLWGCASEEAGGIPTGPAQIEPEQPQDTAAGLPSETPVSTTLSADTPHAPASTSQVSEVQSADVLDVQASGESGSYTFTVEVRSPDTGCEQYADWWEVITPEGELLYRRVLLHSHVGEQPFGRSGGPVTIEPDRTVIVRAHLKPFGYGGQALEGSVEEGFQAVELPADFAAHLSEAAPLPESCAF